MINGLNKIELISLILGMKYPMDYTFATNMEKLGAMKFTGNQWNENWDWNKEYFNKLAEEELVTFYQDYNRNK